MFNNKHLHLFILFFCVTVQCQSDEDLTFCYYINDTDLFTVSYLTDYYKYN